MQRDELFMKCSSETRSVIILPLSQLVNRDDVFGSVWHRLLELPTMKPCKPCFAIPACIQVGLAHFFTQKVSGDYSQPLPSNLSAGMGISQDQPPDLHKKAGDIRRSDGCKRRS